VTFGERRVNSSPAVWNGELKESLRSWTMACMAGWRNLAFATACCFLLPKHAAFAYVPVFYVVNSGQHARIETKADGKPLPGVSVEIYRGFGRHGELPHAQALLVQTSDQRGELTLPTLPSGKYLILARAKPNLEDWLYLHVSADKRSSASLDLNLTPQPPTTEEKLAAAEASTDIARVSQLHGVVCDRVGSPIARANIDVLIAGTQGKQHAGRSRTDSKGEFSIDLPEGRYLLKVSAQGFTDWFRLVVVSRPESSDALQIKLEIAPSNT
jgi:hypothetical protein